MIGKIKEVLKPNDEKKQKMESEIRVDAFDVRTDIKSRFATTVITSRMTNLSNKPKEISFMSRLPEAAFITDFTMQIGDKIVHGEVKEKKVAKQTYDNAVSQGKSAGHVFQKSRETEIFTISTNVGSKTEVIFMLTYQEILQRIHGVYKHVVNLDLDQLQLTTNVQIEVEIVERGEITKIHVPKLGPKIGEKANFELLKLESDPNYTIKSTMDNNSVSTAKVFHCLSASDLSNRNNGNNQFVVLYDLDRDLTGGQVQLVNGYFVHFFAPDALEIGGKHVIFVLDKSGSMSGRKMEQTKDAMRRILGDLKKNDYFNIVWFSYHSHIWKRQSVPGTMDNVMQAISDVESCHADGSTNIHDAIIDGLNLLSKSESNPLASMIVFMTDGQANAGPISSGQELINAISRHNQNLKFIIHTMAFGDDADYGMLQQIAAQNNGLACKIYQDLDADVQLIGFYQQISSPLLADVKINYTQGKVDLDSLVYDHTSTYYRGSEMMILGRLNNLNLNDETDAESMIEAEITGRGCNGFMNLMSKCCRPFPRSRPWIPIEAGSVSEKRLTTKADTDSAQFIERMWAYRTIKKLLKESQLGFWSNPEKETKRTEALALSLKYRFVTELTSMVVVEDDLRKVDLNNVDRDRERDRFDSYATFAGMASCRGGGGVKNRMVFKSCSNWSSSSTGKTLGRDKCSAPMMGELCMSRAAPMSAPPPPPPPPPPKDSRFHQPIMVEHSGSALSDCSQLTQERDFVHHAASLSSKSHESDESAFDIVSASCDDEESMDQLFEEGRKRRSRSRSASLLQNPVSYLVIIIEKSNQSDSITKAIEEWKTLITAFFDNLSKSTGKQPFIIRLVAVNPKTGKALELAKIDNKDASIQASLENVIKKIYDDQRDPSKYKEIQDLVNRQEQVTDKKQIWINVEDLNVATAPLSEVYMYLNKMAGYQYMSQDQLK